MIPRTSTPDTMGGEARIRIADLRVVDSTLAPAKLRAVLAWGVENRAALLAEWARIRNLSA